MKTAALLAAILSVCLAMPAFAQEEAPPADEPASLTCEPIDDSDDSCDGVDASDAALMSVDLSALTCQQCWSFCHGAGPCFNCCCFHQGC